MPQAMSAIFHPLGSPSRCGRTFLMRLSRPPWLPRDCTWTVVRMAPRISQTIPLGFFKLASENVIRRSLKTRSLDH